MRAAHTHNLKTVEYSIATTITTTTATTTATPTAPAPATTKTTNISIRKQHHSHTIDVTEAHQSRSLTCQPIHFALFGLARFGSVLFTMGHQILRLRFSYIFYFSLQHNHFRNYSSVSYRARLYFPFITCSTVFSFFHVLCVLCVNLLLSYCHGHFQVALVLFIHFCM